MTREKDLEKQEDLSKLKRLVRQTNAQLKQTRARTHRVCNRLADGKKSPEGRQEDGWPTAK